MANPDGPHAFRRRHITKERITDGSAGPYGFSSDWGRYLHTENALTCDTCGGSRYDARHTPVLRRRVPRRGSFDEIMARARAAGLIQEELGL